MANGAATPTPPPLPGYPWKDHSSRRDARSIARSRAVVRRGTRRTSLAGILAGGPLLRVRRLCPRQPGGKQVTRRGWRPRRARGLWLIPTGLRLRTLPSLRARPNRDTSQCLSSTSTQTSWSWSWKSTTSSSSSSSSSRPAGLSSFLEGPLGPREKPPSGIFWGLGLPKSLKISRGR